MSFNKNSVEYENYLKNVKLKKIKIFITQIVLLIAFFVLWEVLADKNIINTFLFSKPSDIYSLFISYTSNGTLIKHVWVSVYETLIGLFIGSTLGIIIAIILWWSETLAKYFTNMDEEQIKMLKSFGATKSQILFKLILPGNIGNLINLTKINIGMSWVGVIVGEFLVSRYGIGYLIVYGSQVFKLDVVMMGVFVLAVCAWGMYEVVNLIEKFYYYRQRRIKG